MFNVLSCSLVRVCCRLIGQFAVRLMVRVFMVSVFMVSVLPGSYVSLLTNSSWSVCCQLHGHFADNFIDQFAVKLMVSG